MRRLGIEQNAQLKARLWTEIWTPEPECCHPDGRFPVVLNESTYGTAAMPLACTGSMPVALVSAELSLPAVVESKVNACRSGFPPELIANR